MQSIRSTRSTPSEPEFGGVHLSMREYMEDVELMKYMESQEYWEALGRARIPLPSPPLV